MVLEKSEQDEVNKEGLKALTNIMSLLPEEKVESKIFPYAIEAISKMILSSMVDGRTRFQVERAALAGLRPAFKKAHFKRLEEETIYTPNEKSLTVAEFESLKKEFFPET